MTIRTAVVGLALTLVAGCQPPGVVPSSVDTTDLDRLEVASPGPMTGYDREKFPHWDTGPGGCDTREAVLKRQGINVVVGKGCKITRGTWSSPYDGATWTAATDVDIDHVVPLAEAWRSGASSWTTSKRQQFANDLTRPQLIAVTDNVNQAKGDKDPAAWKPPLASHHCRYAQDWVAVKAHWGLSIDKDEKAALATMLRSC